MDNQMATGGATREEDVQDTRAMNDSGPEHSAPRNPGYSGSFDEFAGAFISDDSVLMAERGGGGYERYREAFNFGHHMATQKHFAGRDWAAARQDLAAEWRKQGHESWDELEASVEKGWAEARGIG